MDLTDHPHPEEHAHEHGAATKTPLRAWLRPAILAGLGLYFNYNLASGNLTNYINVRFAWLSYLAAMLFLLLAAVTAYDLFNARRQGGQHTHDHGLSWAGLAIVAIPLVLGTFIPSRPLGANAVEGDLASGIAAIGSTTAFTSDPLTWNVLDWLRAINSSDDLSGFNGQQADVVGFVYRAESFPPTTFMVARFVISCCAADASAIGLPRCLERRARSAGGCLGARARRLRAGRVRRQFSAYPSCRNSRDRSRAGTSLPVPMSEQFPKAPNRQPDLPIQPRFSRFDRTVFGAVLALILAILVVVLLGDHVGVQLLRSSPAGVARSTSPITIQFSETMNRLTVEERLRLEPTVEGTFAWNGATMIFRPVEALLPGQEYTVILAAGAESDGGRRVLAEHRYTFTVRRPEVAYLAPADAAPQNIWIVDPAAPQHPRQVTFSVTGIYNFDISPDGAQIAFAEHRSDTGTIDLKLLDLESGAVRLLVDCPESDCTSPVWSPDGNLIAYERVEINDPFASAGVGQTRVWLIDLRTDPPTTRPLSSDSQAIGYAPTWSPDGSRVAVFDSSSQGIMIYTLDQDSAAFIPSRHGTVGEFSPDGTRLLFPDVILHEGQGARTHLQIADLETQRFTDLTDPDEPIDDERGVWRPDGQAIAVARRYLDDRYTQGRQIYLIDVNGGNAEPLVVDPDYYHGFFAWAPAGRQLVIQRFPQASSQEQAAEMRPEIWVFEVASGGLVKVAENAFHPRWVP